MSHRKDESDATHFRSVRVVNINGQWFFQVRESSDPVGPFESRDHANRALDTYVRKLDAGRSSLEAMNEVRRVSDGYYEDRF